MAQISKELDELVCELTGDALDILAETGNLSVLLVCEDDTGAFESFEFTDDGIEACLEGAHKAVKEYKGAVRYAIAYLGAAQIEDGSYADALIVEFGEKNWHSFSAYSIVKGIGEKENFSWSEPAAAGELERLL